MHRHLDVAVFHLKKASSLVEITVVVGNDADPASNDAPHVMARAVPLSVKSIDNESPSTGVPERLVVIDVIAADNPVKCATSVVSVLIVGVAPGAFVVTALLVTRLLVNVFVEEMVGTTTPST